LVENNLASAGDLGDRYPSQKLYRRHHRPLAASRFSPIIIRRFYSSQFRETITEQTTSATEIQMTIQDQFAMGAMQAIIVQNGNPYVKTIVQDAYTLADAMLEHRSKTLGKQVTMSLVKK
jgi:hypothetical protein